MSHGVLDFIQVFQSCEDEVVRVLRELDARRGEEMPAGDHRSEPRVEFGHPVPVGVVFKPHGVGSRAHPAYLRDLSMNGASVIHSEMEEVGTRVVITVPFGPGEPLRIEGVVVRSRPVLGSIVEIGLRLTTSVDVESIRDSGRLA